MSHSFFSTAQLFRIRTITCLAGVILTLAACASAGRKTGPTPLPVVELITDAGIIHLEIDTIHAPITASNFLRYVDRGLYDNGTFFRTTVRSRYIRSDTTVVKPIDIIQAARPEKAVPPDDPPIPLENTSVTNIPHVAGVVSMGRSRATQSAQSSFFICVEPAPQLDFGQPASGDGQGYGAFGRVIKGMEVVRVIHQSPANGEKIKNPIVILTAKRVKR